MSKVIINYIIINKKIIKIKIPFYQTFIAPLMATFIVLLIDSIYVSFMFYPLMYSFGAIIAFIPTIIIFFLLIPFLFYFHLTGLLGAWDEQSVDVLKKATKMSGMGKVFSFPMYSFLKKTRRSKLFGKFSIDSREAIKEARELMIQKMLNLDKKR
ncbi:MAG: hypothetical protein ACTSVI_14350 [Promethearchaeota archaeon]